MNAPIILLVYKRVDHTMRTLDALRQNLGARESELIVYSDAPKNADDENQVTAVRNYLKNGVDGFASVTIREKKRHTGLADSVIGAVEEVLASHGRAIVMEDDLVTSRWFLDYMNRALDKYEHDERVISIHGYTNLSSASPYFLRGADCWGWALWRRSWSVFESSSKKLIDGFSPELRRKFDFNGAFPHFKMLQDQAAGKIDSWAIRFHASAFLNEKLTLYPSETLVTNIGLDGSGTHCQEESGNVRLSVQCAALPDFEPRESEEMFNRIGAYYRASLPGLWRRIVRKIIKQGK